MYNENEKRNVTVSQKGNAIQPAALNIHQLFPSRTKDECLMELFYTIIDSIKVILERTPPELAADIFDRGIVMTGGGSLLNGLDQLIEEKTGITTMVAEDPLTAVAIGTGKFIEFQHGDKKEQEFN